MIPRLKPYLNKKELFTILDNHHNAVRNFEQAFAEKFKTDHAIVFPYGRSALWAFLKAMNIKDAEVVQPAYTCSVVAHATILSGNIPVFVDCNLIDYNMDLDQFANAITKKTQAVIPTHLFGFPMDIEEVTNIVRSAEKKYGHKIWIIQDCAHSFDAQHKGKSVINSDDCALFGLGISKQITSIFGGMFTTKSDQTAREIRKFRDQRFTKTSWRKALLRYSYLLASYCAFNSTVYGFVYWLQERTPFLNPLTKAYHLDEKIHFPPDYLNLMTAAEALVGIEQLKKFPYIQEKRRAIANLYFSTLTPSNDLIFPPNIDGATYSHFAIRTPLRDKMLDFFARNGVQLGQLIEYSMPHHPAYRQYAEMEKYPNSLLCSNSMINLPIHPSLKSKELEKIISLFNNF